MNTYQGLISTDDRNTFPQELSLAGWKISFQIIEKNKGDHHELFLMEQGKCEKKMTVDTSTELRRESPYTEEQQKAMVKKFNSKLNDYELFDLAWNDGPVTDLAGLKVYRSSADYMVSAEHYLDRSYLSDQFERSLYREESVQHMYVHNNNLRYVRVYALGTFFLKNNTVTNLNFEEEPMVLKEAGDYESAPGISGVGRISNVISGFDAERCCRIYLRKYGFQQDTLQNTIARLTRICQEGRISDEKQTLNDVFIVLENAKESERIGAKEKAMEYGTLAEQVLCIHDTNATFEQQIRRAMLSCSLFWIYSNDFEKQLMSVVRAEKDWRSISDLSAVWGEEWLAAGWTALVSIIKAGMMYEAGHYQEESCVRVLERLQKEVKEDMDRPMEAGAKKVFQGASAAADFYLGTGYLVRQNSSSAAAFLKSSYQTLSSLETDDVPELQDLLAPFHLNCGRNVGMVLNCLGQNSEAINILEETLDWTQQSKPLLWPNDLLSAQSQIYASLARIWVEQTRPELAETCMDQAVEACAMLCRRDEDESLWLRYLLTLEQAVNVFSRLGRTEKMRSCAERGERECVKRNQYLKNPDVYRLYQEFNEIVRTTNEKGRKKFFSFFS